MEEESYRDRGGTDADGLPTRAISVNVWLAARVSLGVVPHLGLAPPSLLPLEGGLGERRGLSDAFDAGNWLKSCQAPQGMQHSKPLPPCGEQISWPLQSSQLLTPSRRHVCREQ